MNKFFHSDLINEIIQINRLESSKFLVQSNESRSKIYNLESYEIRDDIQAKELGKPKGKYSIISIGDIRTISKVGKSKLIKIIAGRISELIVNLEKNDNILIVGLGNEKIESDSLGPIVAKNVIVTRMMEENSMPKTCSITPSVMGVTGIETADIINAVVDKVKPKIVIIIDSLCASAMERFGKSIQITNVGIVPGGGVNRPKKPLNKENLGCEVITIGVPLMIYASAIANNNVDKDLVVTFHDIGYIVECLSEILIKAINYSIFGFESL